MFKLTIVAAFLAALHLKKFSQEISKKALVGIWDVSEVQVDPNIFNKSNIDNIITSKSIFKNIKFSFSKNGLVKVESPEQMFAPFNSNIFNTVFYYHIENNTISIGSWKKSSNILYAQLNKKSDYLLFNFSGGLLKLKKTENTCKLRINKDALKGQTAFLKQKPLVNSNLGDSIVEENITQPIQTYNCSQIDDNKVLKQCVSQTITRFFNRKFNPDVASKKGLSGKFENKISFVVDKKGNIINIEVTSRNHDLSNEIKRTVNLLPKFIPAKQDGKPINSQYRFPFIFQVYD